MKTATYSLLTLRPDAERIDVLCVGAVVQAADGHWTVATLPSSEKLAAVSSSPEGRMRRLGANLREHLAQCDSLAAVREVLAGSKGALALHEFEGSFAYSNQATFDAQVQAVMAESVLPPPAAEKPAMAPEVHRVRQHTRARLRRQFENMGIMGRHADDIAAHKVVRNFPVSAKHGLNAEFALQNSVMHITETVDFEVAEESVRGKIFEAQAKCLVLRAAREHFGQKTQCYVVVSGSGAGHAARSVDLLSTAGRLVAAENAEDMADYLDRIARAARATGQLGSDWAG
jgi:hypothetical protein